MFKHTEIAIMLSIKVCNKRWIEFFLAKASMLISHSMIDYKVFINSCLTITRINAFYRYMPIRYLLQYQSDIILHIHRLMLCPVYRTDTYLCSNQFFLVKISKLISPKFVSYSRVYRMLVANFIWK